MAERQRHCEPHFARQGGLNHENNAQRIPRLEKENDLIFQRWQSTTATPSRKSSAWWTTRGIGYEVELVRKDLIAMAAQAEARRDYLPSVIGDVDMF